MGYDSYTQLNNLEEISIIAGTEYTLYYTVLDGDNASPVNLNAATINWVMSYYGLDVAAISLAVGSGVTITGVNTFKVVIPSSGTLNLQGKFIHQCHIIDFNGSQFTPGQGVILILPYIQ